MCSGLIMKLERIDPGQGLVIEIMRRNGLQVSQNTMQTKVISQRFSNSSHEPKNKDRRHPRTGHR